MIIASSCGKEASCSDGIQNQGETGIDCFVDGDGICPPCELQPNYNGNNNNGDPDSTNMVTDTTTIPMDTTTTDTTTNSLMCDNSAQMCAIVSGNTWLSIDATGSYSDNILNILGSSDDISQITISYFGILEPTVIAIAPGGAQSIIYSDGTTAFTTGSANSSGSLIITEVDDINKTVSGTFTMIGYDLGGVDSVHINQGKFIDISFE